MELTLGQFIPQGYNKANTIHEQLHEYRFQSLKWCHRFLIFVEAQTLLQSFIH